MVWYMVFVLRYLFAVFTAFIKNIQHMANNWFYQEIHLIVLILYLTVKSAILEVIN